MKTKQLTFLLALTFLFLFSGFSIVFGGALQDGRDAVNREDYKEAVKWYRLSAKQGYAEAQSNLGLMYEKGRGVPKDFKEAVKWSKLAADQGNASTQNNLSYMYYKGQGVPKDYVLAHMWWNIASSNGHNGDIKFRDIIEKRMSPSQLKKAQEMARNWKPKK